tara:strand:- start:955 stop:1503 length:549 start_codon:yes stop_codon:yes gene_type:complete
MTSNSELVVLLNDSGEPVGAAEKSLIHTANTPLHLAFSCHIFNAKGEVLVTRRAMSKKTWPGVWTNSACGHPAPGEKIADAVSRRAAEELGLALSKIEKVLPNFRYQATDVSGIVENEICPVFIAWTDQDPAPSADEVCDWKWIAPGSLQKSVQETPFVFSPWLVMQMDQWNTAYGSDTSLA